MYFTFSVSANLKTGRMPGRPGGLVVRVHGNDFPGPTTAVRTLWICARIMRISSPPAPSVARFSVRTMNRRQLRAEITSPFRFRSTGVQCFRASERDGDGLGGGRGLLPVRKDRALSAILHGEELHSGSPDSGHGYPSAVPGAFIVLRGLYEMTDHPR